MHELRGKTALVTGATKGIGFAVAGQLADKGARVLVHARNRKSGEEALRKLRKKRPGALFDLVVADVASMAGTRALAEAVLAQAPRLDILVNNVGAMYSDLSYSPDGIETTFAVNHLSIFLLTGLLLDRLRASAPARIITIASEVHRKALFDFDDPNLARNYTVTGALAQSKLANILFTRALARRIEGSGVEAYAVHPGHVRTAFTRDLRGWFKIFVAILRIRFLSPDEGAKTAVHLASAPSLPGGNGGYFDDCAAVRPSDHACDEDVAERLWSLSETMTGMRLA
ncbi:MULTISPECIES: SDR family oxidoreductase [unclassified Sphingomonas]|uniref:SDR family oxidoreductase n=1 Tax=unclassified Sphingomonas TaxID=196159 RepID=UPI0006FA591A|nr:MULTISPECIES: SDR family oxidoreductase [unclassified Sphingomonas]KQX23586.1 hypothetical protein ASD17_03675 [Sphingomonas sp. Root1294]KQY68434.1 hypothetical protein ASD39_06195 [Sphingomonas sp. Root50]KRB91163.1 hypothetical protein ASE22_13000 [Sphingomonas sp. Root720]